MEILAFKSLHIIGFTAWFAGLFYLVRMFVYHTEAIGEKEPKRSILADRYALMEARVYSIICTPALVITWIGGLATIYFYGINWLKTNYWLHIKLVLVVILTAYHLYCKYLMVQIKKNKPTFTSFQFRLFNEIPSLLLIAIVILAVFRDLMNIGYALGIVILCGILFYIFTKLYKRIRHIRNQDL